MPVNYLNKTKAASIGILRDVERKHLWLVAAGLTYYLLMSLFPFVIFTSAVITYLPVKNDISHAASFVSHLVPQQGVSLIEELLHGISGDRTRVLSFGIVITLWLASSGMQGIISGLDIVYGVRTPRSMWKSRILAVGLTVGVGALFLLGGALALGGSVIGARLSEEALLGTLWLRVWPFVQWTVAAICAFSAIELLYLLAPSASAARQVTIPGALISAAMWIVLSRGLGFYFHYFGEMKFNMLYGALATPVAIMVWLYWCATAILIGAEINLHLLPSRELQMSEPLKFLEHKTDDAA